MDFRPKWHFTPKQNWINDPNGLIWHNGLYHLYYQHNPLGTHWGHMSWGHATSQDLIYWNEHQVAIAEDEDRGEMIFSGSAVLDKHGDSGHPGAIAAIYTSHNVRNEPRIQSQSLAISTDGGYTFEKQGVVLDRKLSDFRDPKVFRYNDEWRMILVHSLECKAEILRSTDLRNWESLSFFGYREPDGVIWECPDLFELSNDLQSFWVMIISVNPGGPDNGSGTKYFVGDFDGSVFTAIQGPKWLDYGRDNYAGVTYNNEPNGNRILIGWMNSWGKTVHPPLDWTGAMTIPRKLTLIQHNDELLLRQDPVMEPTSRVILGPANNFQHSFNSELDAQFDVQSGILRIAGYEASVGPASQCELEVLIDACSVEIFANERTVSFTFLTFAK